MINVLGMSWCNAPFEWQQISMRLMLMLIHSLWQGAAIGLLLAIMLRWFRTASSNSRYFLACAAFACLPVIALSTFISVDVSFVSVENADQPVPAVGGGQTQYPGSEQQTLPTDFRLPARQTRDAGAVVTSQAKSTAETTRSGPIEPSSVTPGWLFLMRSLAPWMSLLYMAGVLIMLLRIALAVCSGYRLQQLARSVQDAEVICAVSRIAMQLGLQTTPLVAYCHRIATPVVIGFFKPTILLPVSLATQLTPDELSAILSHELAHLRRFDLIVNLLQRIVESLLFFHPVVWWISRQISTERENCCDDVATATGLDNVQYASALLRMAELCLPKYRERFAQQIGALSATGTHPSQLSRRVERLLTMHGTPRLRISHFLFRVILSLLVLITASVAVVAQIGIGPIAAPPVTIPSADKVDPHADAQHEQAATALAERKEKLPESKPKAAPVETQTPDERPATISGRILLQDGSPAPAKGWMYSDSSRKISEFVTNSSSGLAGQFEDRFSFSVPAGTVWISHFSDGFAPAWAGPFVMKSGQALTDVVIVLKPGQSVPIRVENEQGLPVAVASVVVHPEINGKAGGPIRPQLTDERGECVLKHLADTRYALRITAPGYQPLRAGPLTLTADQTLVQKLIRCKPAEGIIRNADATPAVGAKLRAICEVPEVGAFNGFGNSGPGFWGQDFATTDSTGRFKLDQLTTGSHYLFSIEGADGTRVIVHDLRAGRDNVDLKLPARLDLDVKITGDLSHLFKRNGKPFLGVRQHVRFVPIKGMQHGELVGDDVPIDVKPDGGTARFRGVAFDLNSNNEPQQVELSLGAAKKIVELNRNGVTHVEFDLPVTPATVNPGAVRPNAVQPGVAVPIPKNGT